MALKANLDVGGGGIIQDTYIRVVRPTVIDRTVVDAETEEESKEFGVRFWTEVFKDKETRDENGPEIPVSTISVLEAWGYDPDGENANPFTFAYADLEANKAVANAVAA